MNAHRRPSPRPALAWRHRAVLLAMGLSAAAQAGPAHAAAIVPNGIPFTEVLNFSYNPLGTGLNYGNPCCDYLNTVNSAPAAPATSSYAQSGAWGSVAGTASANLATGQLKMRSNVVDADGTGHPSLQTNAIFGDSFHASTPGGSPFTWSAASQAAFTLNLSGSLTSSAPLPSLGPGAFVVLSILRPGTLDPAKPLINGPTAEQYFYWNIGNPGEQISYTDQAGNSQPLTPTGSFTSIPPVLTASFRPGGDFDWVLFLGASGQLGGAGSSFDLDLSHTLTLGYAGPQGSVTTAASRQFANFNPTLAPAAVPEPASLTLLGAGLALGLVMRLATVLGGPLRRELRGRTCQPA